jgi:hypothetical protein
VGGRRAAELAVDPRPYVPGLCSTLCRFDAVGLIVSRGGFRRHAGSTKKGYMLVRLKLPRSFFNVISYIGMLLIVISICSFLFLYILSSIAPTQNPYIGLVLFLVIPAPFVLGLVLVPAGMLRAYRRQTGIAAQGPPLPVIDFNTTRNKIAFAIFAVGGVLFGTFIIYELYEGYHYTETTTFCGELCHQVMQPEYVTYSNSPHARVGCAECHVGSGANFYVKSKLSGSYQVYATLRNIYPRPIPTPVKNLRPARETCEECHWPEKFYESQQITNHHYVCDDENTPWTIDMLIKIGMFIRATRWSISRRTRSAFPSRGSGTRTPRPAR